MVTLRVLGVVVLRGVYVFWAFFFLAWNHLNIIELYVSLGVNRGVQGWVVIEMVRYCSMCNVLLPKLYFEIIVPIVKQVLVEFIWVDMIVSMI